MRPDDVILDHAVFRVLLRAMSRPGTVHPLPFDAAQDDGLAYIAGLLRCVADNEAAFCVLGPCEPGAGGEIARRTGGREAPAGEADIVIALSGTTGGTAGSIRRGSLEFPEKGATVVYRVDALAPDGGTESLSGPGIESALRPRIAGLGDGELGFLKEANAAFPLGVDAIFVDRAGQVACIPRSTRIGGP
ncbi:MAG: phosphonate C-P lyase system protein PhnH [Thermodesulfobacteriota bacterium]